MRNLVLLAGVLVVIALVVFSKGDSTEDVPFTPADDAQVLETLP